MKIDKFKHADNWQDVKDATMNTIGKNTGAYPDSKWKRQLILSEHSPIRKLKFEWRWYDLKSWVSVHFVRHKFGIDHFVKTQRTDRTGMKLKQMHKHLSIYLEKDYVAARLLKLGRRGKPLRMR